MLAVLRVHRRKLIGADQQRIAAGDEGHAHHGAGDLRPRNFLAVGVQHHGRLRRLGVRERPAGRDQRALVVPGRGEHLVGRRDVALLIRRRLVAADDVAILRVQHQQSRIAGHGDAVALGADGQIASFEERLRMPLLLAVGVVGGHFSRRKEAHSVVLPSGLEPTPTGVSYSLISWPTASFAGSSVFFASTALIFASNSVVFVSTLPLMASSSQATPASRSPCTNTSSQPGW